MKFINKFTEFKKKYKSNEKYATEYTQWFIEILAIPQGNKNLSITQKIIFFIKIITIFTSIAWNAFLRFLEMCWNVKRFDDKLFILAPTVFITITLLKYIIILLRRNEIKEFIENIKSDWLKKKSPEEELIMVKNAQLSNRITLYFIILMYTSGFLYNLVIPLVLPIIFITKPNNSERLPIFPGYDVLFNAQVSPIYEIYLLFEVYSVITVFSVLIFMCHLTVVSVSHACGQIQIINYLMRYLFNDIEEKTVQIKISNIIDRHVKTLEFSKMIQKTLVELCLLEMGASTALLCIDEYCFLKVLERKDVANMIPFGMIFVCLNFNILVLCYFSELLNSQSFEIGKQAYILEWYRFPVKIRTYITFIICSSQRIQKLTAGGIIDLSYTTYVQILKTGFTYFQILRTTEMQK